MGFLKNLEYRFRLKRYSRQAWQYVLNNPRAFDDLEKVCLFIGYQRSSHSLMGSILDAHPEAVVAHELDALTYVKEGFSREQLFALMLQNSQHHGRKGREQTGYSYQVPNQYQGTCNKLRVIGDKRGNRTSQWLRTNPELLGELKQLIGLPLHFVHVTRNPFDNIATMAKRDRRVKGNTAKITEGILEHAKNEYIRTSQVIERVRNQLDDGEFFTMHIEDFLAYPGHYLRELMDFLDLPVTEQYLADAQRILFSQPRKSRFSISWPTHMIEEVEQYVQTFYCLRDYHFND